MPGPASKHNIQRALHVRNLRLETALTKEQSAYLDHRGSYEPKPRLRDMDDQGIDQVMIIPTNIDTYPWLQNAMGARAWCKVYNDWAYEYTQEDPERLYFAALLPVQDPQVRRGGALPRGGHGLSRWPHPPHGCHGQLPGSAQVRTLVERHGGDWGGVRMHPFPASGLAKPPGTPSSILPPR